MGPEALAQVLRPLAGMFDPGQFPDLLQGLSRPDDAAVWRLDGERALVLTSDFFPPVVDDPYDFGAIAAANALSDLYAMGARPLMGINLVGFPSDLDPAILSEILRGGAETVQRAGGVIAGGHTTTDSEPKYGLAVIGLVHPDRVLTKGGARDGDRLFLTKPLGTGAVATALKKDAVDPSHLSAAVASMTRLNAGAAEALEALEADVHAATDITGFSLAGHGHEMAEASEMTLRLDWDRLPLLDGAESYARQGLVPGGAKRNRAYFGRRVRFTRELDGWQDDLLFDPQTSGGLFFAVAADRAADVEAAFREVDEPLWSVGEAVPGGPHTIEIV